MDNDQARDILREMLARWSETRAAWIRLNGSDDGFAEWFSEQFLAREESDEKAL